MDRKGYVFIPATTGFCSMVSWLARQILTKKIHAHCWITHSDGDRARASLAGMQITHLCAEHYSVFLRAPFTLLDAGIKMIKPSFSALLAYPARKPRRNHRPLDLLHGQAGDSTNQPCVRCRGAGTTIKADATTHKHVHEPFKTRPLADAPIWRGKSNRFLKGRDKLNKTLARTHVENVSQNKSTNLLGPA